MRVCRVLVLALAAAGAAHAQYYPSGPQTNVPVASLSGWTQCYTDLYNNGSTALATIQAQCSGTYLLMACRLTGDPTLILLAAAPRADVLTDTGTGNTTHDANGVAWYFNSNWSWGFAPAGVAVNRNSCDIASGSDTLRLCWHAGSGNINGGWRCGATTGLNASTAYERLVFHSSTVPVALQSFSAD